MPQKSSPEEAPVARSEAAKLDALRKEIRQLKAQLKRKELGHKAYKLLVEIAEETYGIDIRKNIEAK